ncbi:hypothetical protein TNCV_2930841 [Trichonephila clavipes]|nr:hypothetical protein TNCV_2930841 [Trichonephila clavipes]
MGVLNDASSFLNVINLEFSKVPSVITHMSSLYNISNEELSHWSCSVTSPNIKSGRHLCWTRHPHMHLAAAAQPLFDPRGIEHRRPEDERERCFELTRERTVTAGSDVVQSGRPIFDDFFQHLWPYIVNNTANVVFQMVKRLWLIRIDQ